MLNGHGKLFYSGVLSGISSVPVVAHDHISSAKSQGHTKMSAYQTLKILRNGHYIHALSGHLWLIVLLDTAKNTLQEKKPLVQHE